MSALLQANQATLLIVDMQGRLMPAIHDGQAVLAAAHKLAQAARLLDVPVVATEHHARMLGVTVAPLDTQIQARFPKMHFSATREPGFTAWLPPARASRPITMRPCAARAAPAPKSYRHHRDGDFRMDGNLRTSQVSRRVTFGQMNARSGNNLPASGRDCLPIDTIPGQT
ncbi:isochorismatase domain protein [Bordetella pertussis 2371640]|nr:isochorismatase domain protein [Bordetella pertussis 2371640]